MAELVTSIRASVAAATAAGGPSPESQAVLQQLAASVDNALKPLSATATSGLLDNAIASLTLPQDTLVYIALLGIKVQKEPASSLQTQLFLKQATDLLLFGSARCGFHVKPDTLKAIARAFANATISADMAQLAIGPLEAAIKALRPSPNSLTPLHADFVKVCLLSHNYEAALTLVQDDILDVDPSVTSVEPKDVVTYFYYAGLVYTGLKQLSRAYDAYLVAVTMPAQVLSAVVLEAYKKISLVALLLHGEPFTLPKYTPESVSRHLPNIAVGYSELAKAFSTFKAEELDKTVTKYRADFEKDRNFGLVKQVVDSLKRRNIQRLTNTFVTLSLGDIAKSGNLLNAKEAESILLRMIADGEIFATIDQSTGMVSFQSEDESFDTKSTVDLLDQHIHLAIQLSANVTQADRRVTVSEDYVRRTQEKSSSQLTDFDDFESTAKTERVIGGTRFQ